MKIMLFGKPTTLAGQKELAQFIRRCESNLGPVERFSATSRDGIAKMELYDIVVTPAWVVARDDGEVIGVWQHRQPLLDELSAHL